MARFGNLTQEAVFDLRRELKRSRQFFGDEQTLRIQNRLLDRFRATEDGLATGHRHAFAGPSSQQILCITVAPLLIFYDADTRVVLRVVDGRRDLSRLFAEPS